MIRLQLLGSQQLEREGRESLDAVVAQPKRFALLAYLALAAGTFVRRDTVLLVFWPELDQFAARRALRNTVYQLRRALGAGVFRTRGDEEISVDAAELWCDVTALAAAVEGRRFEEAVGLYRGELFRGFHLPGGEEDFESWLSEQRDRSLRQVLRALDALASHDEQAGRRADAARWAMRAHEIAPFDETWVRRAMTQLAAAGERGNALRTFDAFARRLRDEMGGTPAADTARLAARLRAEAATATPDPAPRTVAPIVATSPVIAAPGTSLPPAPVAPASMPIPPGTPTAPSTGRSWWTRRASFLTGVAALVIVGTLLAVMARQRQRTRADPHRLVVSIFRNRTGDPRLESVGDMAADWISRGLFAAGLGEVIDPQVLAVRGRRPDGQPVDPEDLARLTGAGTIVEGQYYRSGDSLLFVVSIADAASGRITGQVGPVGGPIARPVAALDDVRNRTMTALSLALDPRFALRMPRGLEAPAFPVYANFMRGWNAFWLGDRGQAEEFFREAARGDTTFAPAAAALAMAAAHTNHCARSDSLERAWPSGRPGLTEADRLTLAIAVAHCRGDNDERLRLTVARARLQPRSSSSQLTTAIAALWADRPTEALGLLRAINPAIDLAWMPDSAHYGYFEALAEADHLLGRYGDELAAADQLRQTVPLGWAWLRGRALVGLGREREAMQVADTALTLRADPRVDMGIAAKMEGRPEYSATGGWAATWIAREFFTHGDSADGRIVAARALAWAGRRNAAERSTIEVRLLEATTRDLVGDYLGARTVLALILPADTSDVDVRGLMAGAAAGAGDTAAAATGDRWLARLDGDEGTWAAPLYRARIAAREGRAADAIALLRAVQIAGGWPLWVHCDPAVFPLRERSDYQLAMAPRG